MYEIKNKIGIHNELWMCYIINGKAKGFWKLDHVDDKEEIM